MLPPIPTDNLTSADVEDLTRYTRDTMLKALTTLTNSPRGQRAARPELQTCKSPARPLERVSIRDEICGKDGSYGSGDYGNVGKSGGRESLGANGVKKTGTVKEI